jgi:DNA-binding response OmpR family regulator
MAELAAPDIAILDIGMPLITGNELARWMRKQPWGNQATLIAVTGWGQAEDRQNTAEAGFDMHLVKPVAVSEIVRVVSETLAERRNP